MVPRVGVSALLFRPVLPLSAGNSLARDDLLFLAPHLHFTSLISWFTASRQKMNSLHFVLLNQNGMGKTGLIIFYSNPTYLYHLLLSPVRSDMSAISCPRCWLGTGPRLCLFMAPALFYPKTGSGSEQLPTTPVAQTVRQSSAGQNQPSNGLFCHWNHIWNRACKLGLSSAWHFYLGFTLDLFQAVQPHLCFTRKSSSQCTWRSKVH